MNDGVASHADADPPNGDPEKTLDFGDVVLRLDRQVLELAALADGLVPSWHGDVLHLHTFESLKGEVRGGH